MTSRWRLQQVRSVVGTLEVASSRGDGGLCRFGPPATAMRSSVTGEDVPAMWPFLGQPMAGLL